MACIEHKESNGVVQNGHEEHWCYMCKHWSMTSGCDGHHDDPDKEYWDTLCNLAKECQWEELIEDESEG